jgi:glutaredoxin
MATKNTDDIHALTTAEINRQTREHSERVEQIKNQRAAMFATALKNGAVETPVIFDDDEKAARLQAKGFLNGSAPASLLLPPELTLDKTLYREQRAREIVLKILADKGLVARAADAVIWAEKHGDQWRTLCREITLAAIRLEALEHSASELLERCPDIFALRWPMTNVIGGRAISEIPLNELKEIALTEGILSAGDIRKAANVA